MQEVFAAVKKTQATWGFAEELMKNDQLKHAHKHIPQYKSL